MKLLCTTVEKSSVRFKLVTGAESHSQEDQVFTLTCAKTIQRSMSKISRSLSHNEEERIVANGEGKRGRETHMSALDIVPKLRTS